MKAFPYDSLVTYDTDGNAIYDRFVLAETERTLNKALFTSGIYANPMGGAATVSSGMTVSLSSFMFNIDGVRGMEEVATQWTLDVGSSLPRYDRIILRNDNSSSIRFPAVAILKGTTAAEPTAPAITRSGDIYDLVLCTIYVGAQVTELTDENIEDDRLASDLCGVVTQAIDSVDTTTLFTQLQDQVDSNIALIQSAIDETTEGLLQTQIDANATDISANATSMGDTADLDTTDTSSLVNAINENVASAADNAITSGSDTNGSWIKFPDGTMECRTDDFTISTIVSIFTGTDNRISGNWTFPATFIATPQVTGTFTGGSDEQCYYANLLTNGISTSLGGAYLNLINTNSFATGSTANINLVAKGKWK